MKHTPISNQLFVENRKNFNARISPDSIAIFHSNDMMPRNGDQYFPFRQQSDFFYLTGINQEKSILLLAPNHPDPKYREMLFLIETNEKIAVWEGHKFTMEEAKKISGIENVYWLSSYGMFSRELLHWCEHVYLNAYEYPKYSTDVVSRNARFTHQLMQDFPTHKYERSAPILTQLRMIKSAQEIDLIKRAIEITNKAFRRMLGFVKPGVMEYQIQAGMEYEFTYNGAWGSAYQPIIASGTNSCVLHYIDNDKECLDGDVVLFDFGAEYANYAADISRIIPVNGKFTKRQRELYELVLRVQKKAIAQLVPGNTTEAYNKFVNTEMEKEMIQIGLLDKVAVKNQDPEKPIYKKYFMHGTAHHLGLDVHDVYDKHEPFRVGMVFTCEPGIYVPEEKTGIRIENNIFISEDGPVDLSANIPREADDIERLMQRKV